MGGRASRRGKLNDLNDTFRYDALPPGSDSFELASLDDSTSSSSSSGEIRVPQKLSFMKTQTLNTPISRIHQYNHTDQSPLNPTAVLEHLVRETLPTLSEAQEPEMFFTENRFSPLESAKEEKASISSGSDSGDISGEQLFPSKISDQEEEHIEEVSEIDIQSVNDYHKFCSLIRPQLECLLNGYPLDKIPFTYSDYKRLLI